jgi:hypothetical protein
MRSAGRYGTEILRLVPMPDRFCTQIVQAVEGCWRLAAGYPASPAPGESPAPLGSDGGA